MMDWFKNLSWVVKLTGLFGGLAGLSFLGGASQYVLAFFKAIWQLVEWAWEGLQLSISKPVVIAFELLIFAFGVYQGINWDAHRAITAETRLASLETQLKEQSDVDASRAKAAIAARDAATAKSIKDADATPPILQVPTDLAACSVVRPHARPSGVRAPARSSQTDDVQNSLQSLFRYLPGSG